ncbi:hypothetical protein [Leptospira santarosai]|nr:hypothetical protein [Leptospira santarosai]MDI7190783.1 hypothetical protein [Leptospira santarosai]MDI7211416.1 hypothetical protein [Leptospira santarosai]MDI7220062.1 hypothetical protein [Leptospira santarosai]
MFWHIGDTLDPGLETTFCNVVPVGQAIVEIVRGYDFVGVPTFHLKN